MDHPICFHRATSFDFSMHVVTLLDELMFRIILESIGSEPCAELATISRAWAKYAAANVPRILLLRFGGFMGAFGFAMKHRRVQEPMQLLAMTDRETFDYVEVLELFLNQHAFVHPTLAQTIFQTYLPDFFNASYLLMEAATGGYIRVAEASMRAGADTQDGRVLFSAAANGHTGIARLVLPVDAAQAAQAATQLGWALVVAADNGHFEIVKLLLEAPFLPIPANTRDSMALSAASGGGYIEIVKILLEAPDHPALADSRDGLPLARAAAEGHIEVVKLLMQTPVHTAYADMHGGIALVAAAKYGHTQVVRLLLEAKVRPALPISHEGRALELAILRGHTETAKLLMDFGG
eukprot:gene12719-biopygen10634